YWTDCAFHAKHSSTNWKPFLRNERLASKGFQNNATFERELLVPGTGFKHSRKRELHLHGFFVYPMLYQRPLQRKIEADAISHLKIKSQDILTLLIEEPNFLILGSDRAGKTSLAKMLYRDAQK